ncbi:MAG: VOC family protein [Pseudomonadota bacterium]
MQQTSAMEVGISVMDLPQMLGFYTEALGCREVRRADIPAALSAPLTLAADGYLCVWLQTPGGEIIKLMAPPTAPQKLVQPERLTEQTGIAYLTFYVDDIAAVLAAAEERGATLRSERALVTEGAGAVKLGFLEDPEGNVVELVEALAG